MFVRFITLSKLRVTDKKYHCTRECNNKQQEIVSTLYSLASEPTTYECMHNSVIKSCILTEASYYFAHRNYTVSKHVAINTIMSTAFQRVKMVSRKPRPEVFGTVVLT